MTDPASNPAALQSAQALVATPRAFIEQELFPRNDPQRLQKRDPTDDWGVSERCQAVLHTATTTSLLHATVPSLNDVASTTLRPGTLVRLRCMVQDARGPEYFPGVFAEVHQATGTRTLRTGKYLDVIDAAPGSRLDLSPDNTITYDRQVVSCVALPGEAPWVQQRLRGSVVSNPVSERTNRGKKRVRAVEPTTTTATTTPDAAAATATAPQAKRERIATTPADQGTHHRPDIAAPPSYLVKVYGSAAEADFKVGTAVEVIGILSVDPSITQFSEESSSMDYVPPVSSTPRIHCLFHRILTPASGYPLGDPSLVSEAAVAASHAAGRVPAIRKRLVAHIATTATAGDVLAAEFVVLNLVSRVRSRTADPIIGPLVLNLTANRLGAQATAMPQALYLLYQSVLPAVVPIVLAPEALSRAALHPVKDYDANLLHYGKLQAPSGTAFILDETRMSAGTLTATGVKNLRALTKLALQATLEYDFTYNVLDFEADNPMVIVSSSKSLLPNHVRVPVVADATRASGGVGAASAPTAEEMDAFRTLIQLARVGDCPVSAPAAKAVEAYFVGIRQRVKGFSADALHLMINVSQLLAASHMETEVTEARWTEAVGLMDALSSRIVTAAGGTGGMPAWCTVPSFGQRAAPSTASASTGASASVSAVPTALGGPRA